MRLKPPCGGVDERQHLPILVAWATQQAPALHEVNEVLPELIAVAVAIVMAEVDDRGCKRTTQIQRQVIAVGHGLKSQLVVPHPIIGVIYVGEGSGYLTSAFFTHSKLL